MGFLTWLESTGLAAWVGGSLWGYPSMLTTHSVGLAIVVGLLFMMSLRFLGVAGNIPVSSFERFFPVAWFGFAINALSGGALFTMQATWYITNIPFLLKIAGIVVGVVLMVILQKELKAATEVTSKLKTLGIVSLIAWSVAMIGGRFIAYI